jgi:hypothetical protein
MGPRTSGASRECLHCGQALKRTSGGKQYCNRRCRQRSAKVKAEKARRPHGISLGPVLAYLPHREDRVACLAARAALGLPLFPLRVKDVYPGNTNTSSTVPTSCCREETNAVLS